MAQKVTSLRIKKNDGTFSEPYLIGADASNVKYNDDFPSVRDKIEALENSNTAPIEHADPSEVYGVGSTGEYGHLKISDAFGDDTQAAASGIAMSQKGVNTLFNKYLNFQIINGDTLFSSINTGFKSDTETDTMDLVSTYYSLSENTDGSYTLVVENDKGV